VGSFCFFFSDLILSIEGLFENLAVEMCVFVVKSGDLIFDELCSCSQLILIVEGLLLCHLSEVLAKKVDTSFVKSGFGFC